MAPTNIGANIGIDMTRDEFRRMLKRAGITQASFGRACGVNPRTVRRWVLGETPIPRWARLLTHVMVTNGMICDDLPAPKNEEEEFYKSFSGGPVTFTTFTRRRPPNQKQR